MPKNKNDDQADDKHVSPAFEKAVKAGIASIKTTREDLEAHDLASKTADERQYSTGKLRDGEAEVQGIILDTMDKFPGLFASLAAKDHGNDDKVLETAPSRAALARIALLVPLKEQIEILLARVSDDILESAELVKDVTVPAYAIIKANEGISPEVRKSAAGAITFYANLAKKKEKKKKPNEK